MKSNFILHWGEGCGEVTTMTFPAGEVNVTLPKGVKGNRILVEAFIRDSDGVMALALIKDAINHIKEINPEVLLVMGYTPYLQQDRVCNQGEALSAKVFCTMVNNMGFDKVEILDPHSDVGPAVLNNCEILTQSDVVGRWFNNQHPYDALVSPDFGATKKTQKLAKQLNYEVIQGVKDRNLQTGELTGFNYYGDVEGKNLLIVDDICVGGGTFIGLAEKLKAGGARSIDLYVSHGIFSNGVELLLDNGIDHIYTTNSFTKGIDHPKLTIIAI